MADYFKSLEKKYCDVCKCWVTDNQSSVELHASGKRHKENVQMRIRDSYLKNKKEENQDKTLDEDMRRIEKAALVACKKDSEDNPDVSMKLQNYYDKLKTESDEPEGSVVSSKEVVLDTSVPKIHRSDKKKKADCEVMTSLNKSTPLYSPLGEWQTIQKNMMTYAAESGNYLSISVVNVSLEAPGGTAMFEVPVLGIR